MRNFLVMLVLALPVTDHGGCPAGWYYDTNQHACVYAGYPPSL